MINYTLMDVNKHKNKTIRGGFIDNVLWLFSTLHVAAYVRHSRKMTVFGKLWVLLFLRPTTSLSAVFKQLCVSKSACEIIRARWVVLCKRPGTG